MQLPHLSPRGRVGIRYALRAARLAPALVLFGAAAATMASHVPATRADGAINVVLLFQVGDRDYDGGTDATVNPGHCLVVAEGSLDPIVDPGLSCDDSGATAHFLSRNAGVQGAEASGITLSGGTGTYNVVKTLAGGRISAVALTIAAVTDTKVYDGGVTSSASPNVNGLQPGDTVDATQAFGSKNVLGTNGSTLSVTDYTVNDGNGGGNYVVDSSGTATGTITPAALTISAVTDTKVYDGGVSSTATPGVSGLQPGGDTVTGLVQAFDSKDVAGTDGSTLSVTDYTVNDGNSGNNYTVDDSAPATGTITPRALVVTAHGVNKVYNGYADATVTLTDDRVSGDVFTDSYGAASFVAGKNVGSGKAISVTGIGISGADAIDYTPNTTANASADITKAPITVTATINNKTADGTTSAAAIPSPTTIYGTDTAGFSEAYASSSAGSGKQLTPSGIVNDGNSGGNYSYTFVSIYTGNIRPAPAYSMSFSAQPIDTKASTPIYDSCTPPPGGATYPCAKTSDPGPSAQVQVTVLDRYGNLAGPGAPGADGSNAAITVSVKNNTSAGAPLGSAVTINGVARFGDQMSIATPGATHLFASTTDGSAPTATSTQFLIAAELKACQGTICVNQSNGTGTVVYGQIIGTQNFYGPNTNVLLSTTFSSASDSTGKCGVNSSSHSTGTIGSTVEQRVSGYGIQIPLPNETQVFIIPLATLQALHIQSRDADDFSACLGAVNLNSRFAPSSPWNAARYNYYGDSHHSDDHWWFGLQSAVGSYDSTDPNSLYRYWGVPAWCGNPGLSATDPCTYLKTKNATWLSAALGGISVSAFFHSGDIAIVVREPNPWDGKAGIYS